MHCPVRVSTGAGNESVMAATAIHLTEKNDDQAIVRTIRNLAFPDIIFA
jgi:hypothetical protein